jgi:two-component system response regulator DesR
MRPRVLLADDHLEMLAAVERLIAPECDVVGKISDGAEVLPAVARLRPDVLVVDLNMPNLDGVEICRRIVHSHPDTAVVVVTAEIDAALADLALKVGARAFIPKHATAEDLPAAIARIVASRRP